MEINETILTKTEEFSHSSKSLLELRSYALSHAEVCTHTVDEAMVVRSPKQITINFLQDDTSIRPGYVLEFPRTPVIPP